jgi:NADH-ubiquinone oxidoreductase chain 6
MNNFLIDILAFATLLSSVLVITSKNPVIAVIFLISVFVNAAGYLILSGVGFIGISYIIVYIGAIAVLFLFVIMMINIRLTDILEVGSQYTKNLPLAIAISLLFLYELYTIMPFTFNNISIISALLNIFTYLNVLLLSKNLSVATDVYTTFNPNIADTTFINFLQIQAIGQSLYTFLAILLIVTSVILLLSMIAPIFLSRTLKSNKSNPLY